MGKLIIENRSANISDLDCLELIDKVIAAGRISNHGKQYCYLSIITLGDHTFAVATDLNKNSDRFVINDGKH